MAAPDRTRPARIPGLRVALVQMDVADGDLEENMRRAEQGIRGAAAKGADLVCLPEAADFGWLHQRAREVALPVPGRYTDFLCALAKELRVWVCAGCLEKDGEKTYNSAVLIDRAGAVVLKHRKISTLPELTAHLYDAGSARDIKTADTEFGRVGLSICADNFNIAHPLKAAKLGAWLLIAPHGFAEKEEDLLDNGVSFITTSTERRREDRPLGRRRRHRPLPRRRRRLGRIPPQRLLHRRPAREAKVHRVGPFIQPALVVCDIPAEPAPEKAQ
jgi:predicted amidohydrolase